MEVWLTILFFQQFKSVMSFLLVTMVYGEKSAVIQNVLFQTFSLPLVFSSLTMMSLGLDFFGFILLGVCWACIIYRLSFVKHEMLPTFIFEILMTQMLDILVISRSLRLFFFFFLIFSSVFRMGIYIDISLSSPTLLLWFLFWYYIHCINFIFSVLELPFGSSL